MRLQGWIPDLIGLVSLEEQTPESLPSLCLVRTQKGQGLYMAHYNVSMYKEAGGWLLLETDVPAC